MQDENTKNSSINALQDSIALSRIVIDLLQERKKDIRRQWIFMLVMCLSFVLMVAAIEVNNYCSQKELYTQLENTRIDFMEYLDSLEYEYSIQDSEVTTQTQTVEGDNAEINNVQGNQYKDNATHNETGGED